jgi:large subunit ribosomal protein L21
MASYAIIRDGGRQYRVSQGDVFEMDRLGLKVGEKATLKEVLLLADGDNVKIGTPLVAGASVEVESQGEVKGEKLFPFFYRPKKNSSRRKKGHRQHYTRVKITSVKG